MSAGMQNMSAISIAKPRVPFNVVEIPMLRGITIGAFWISSAMCSLAPSQIVESTELRAMLTYMVGRVQAYSSTCQ